MAVLEYPRKVVLGDITVRDGFQHEEKFIPTEAKLWVAEQLILAGFRRIEVTNFGNPSGMPQFKDADALMRSLRGSRKVAELIDDVEITAITIREKAVERAIQARHEGCGPDRVLFMVSTSESHHKVNSGLSLDDYWKMCEHWIPRIHDAGMKVCGTVSTIWGCPIEAAHGIEEGRRVQQALAGHRGRRHRTCRPRRLGSPNRVFEYYSMIMDTMPDPSRHVAHFHVTRGWGLANVLAALQAGITHFESTLGGIGGQPANFVDGVPVAGTGKYYYEDPTITGLVCTEDMVVMMDEMGIDTGLDVDRVLETGRMVERIVGRRLRSECAHSGRIPKSLTGRR